MSGFDSSLRDYWYPVALSSDVGDKPAAAMLLGERVVLWRSKSGLLAMADRCIHRGTKLSLGWIKDDQLVCPYHGWCYNEEGAVTRIPAIPAERGIPSRARVARYHCVERYGLVYVCLGTPRRAIYEVPEFEQEDYKRHIMGPVKWNASAGRSLENFIDEAHLPWAHPGALGNQANVPVIPARDIKENEGDFYFEYHSECQNRLDPSKTSVNLLTYHVVLPFELYHEHVTPDGERLIDLFYCTPNTETESTRYMVVARNYALDQPAERFIKFTSTVWEQDRVLVESQEPYDMPLDLDGELHLRGPDGPAVAYRRMLRRLTEATSN